MPDEELLVSVQLALEQAKVAAIDGAAERHEVREPVPLQQLARREHAEDKARRHEVAQDEALVLEGSGRTAREREGQLSLRLRELRVEEGEAACTRGLHRCVPRVSFVSACAHAIHGMRCEAACTPCMHSFEPRRATRMRLIQSV